MLTLPRLVLQNDVWMWFVHCTSLHLTVPDGGEWGSSVEGRGRWRLGRILCSLPSPWRSLHYPAGGREEGAGSSPGLGSSLITDEKIQRKTDLEWPVLHDPPCRAGHSRYPLSLGAASPGGSLGCRTDGRSPGGGLMICEQGGMWKVLGEHISFLKIPQLASTFVLRSRGGWRLGLKAMYIIKANIFWLCYKLFLGVILIFLFVTQHLLKLLCLWSNFKRCHPWSVICSFLTFLLPHLALATPSLLIKIDSPFVCQPPPSPLCNKFGK